MPTRVLTTGRFEIPYTIWGDGPHTLVCVNAMQQTMAAWRDVGRRLIADHEYSVVLFDFPNQGRARRLHGPASVGLIEQVEVLRAVVHTTSPDAPVALFGGSWGAVIAATYAAHHPQTVSRLVLGSFQARANGRLRLISSVGRALVEQGRTDDVVELFMREFGTHLPAAHQRAIRTQFGSLRPEQFLQMYEQAAMLAGADDLTTVADLSAITAETLIVNGAEDPIVDARDPDTLRRLPSAELRVVAGVGHFLHHERPDVIDIYAEFLHRNVNAGPAKGERYVLDPGPAEAGRYVVDPGPAEAGRRVPAQAAIA